MALHIAEMIKKGNAEAVERYVKNHLPTDTASLERIYKELLQYNPAGENEQQKKMPTKSKSVTSLFQKNKPKGIKEEPVPIEIKRTQNLIKLLRQKGFKINNADQEQGLSKFKAHKERLTKPHIFNNKLLKSQQAVIDKLINRYAINTKYYNNEIEDVKFEVQKMVDPDMREFIERRNVILQSFKNKTNDNSSHSNKFRTVTCRVYDTPTNRACFQKMPSMKDTASTNRKLSPTRKLVEVCNDQIKQQKFKEVKPNRNYFSQTKLKLQRQFDTEGEDEDTDQQSNFKQKLQKIQFQRYTNTYMKMMNNKIKQGSKCKLSNYAKDLLRDERKMRNIIDFSNK